MAAGSVAVVIVSHSASVSTGPRPLSPSRRREEVGGEGRGHRPASSTGNNQPVTLTGTPF